jgi:hypothetical protein
MQMRKSKATTKASMVNTFFDIPTANSAISQGFPFLRWISI